MRYDKPVREMLVDAVNDLPAVFTRADMVTWINRNYPSVKDSTVTAYITAGTVNSRSRHQHPGADQLLIYKRNDGLLERYDCSRHGQWDKWGQRIKVSGDAERQQACAPDAPKSTRPAVRPARTRHEDV